MNSNILNELCKVAGLEYAVCDADLTIQSYSPGLPELIETDAASLKERPLEHISDELVGMRETLQQIQAGELKSLKIELAARPLGSTTEARRYITLKVAPFEDGLLLLVYNQTDLGVFMQKLIQQRNDLRLLIGRLVSLQEEMNTLIKDKLPYTQVTGQSTK